LISGNKTYFELIVTLNAQRQCSTNMKHGALHVSCDVIYL